MGYEEYLKERLCPHCHFAILDPHPEEKFSHVYLKCKLCGFSKPFELAKSPEQIKNSKLSKK